MGSSVAVIAHCIAPAMVTRSPAGLQRACLAGKPPHVCSMGNDIDPELAAAPAVLQRFRRALNWSLAAVVGLALIFFLQSSLGDLRAFTIQPQHVAGLPGVLTAPLLHGSIGHLAANALSVLILGTLAGTVFPRATLRALPLLWIGSGLVTWLIGTGGFHLGASGVTHGLGFLVFTLGVLRRDRAAIAASLIAFFFFGGMLMTVLPQELGVSWEYHLGGAIFGVACGVVWRRADPTPPRRRYSWEDEAEPVEEAGDALEPSRPDTVPVIWRRVPVSHGEVLLFPRRGRSAPLE